MWRQAKHTFTPTKLTTLPEDQIDLFNQSRYPTYISHACQELLQFKIGCINLIRPLQKQRIYSCTLYNSKISIAIFFETRENNYHNTQIFNLNLLYKILFNNQDNLNL